MTDKEFTTTYNKLLEKIAMKTITSGETLMITPEKIVKLYKHYESPELYDSWDIAAKIIEELLKDETPFTSYYYYLIYLIHSEVRKYVISTYDGTEMEWNR